MSKSIIKQFFTIGIGTIVSMMIGFLTTPIITRIFNPDQYGIYSLFIVYGNIVMITLGLGMDQGLARYYYEEDDVKYKKWLVCTCVTPALVLTFFCCAFVFMLLYFYNIEFRYEKDIVLLFLLYLIILVIYRFIMVTLRLERKSKEFASLNVMQKVLFVSFLFLFIWIGVNKAPILLCVSYTLAVFLCGCYGLLLCGNIWFSKESKRIEKVSRKMVFHYSIPFVLSLGVSALLQALDRIALEKYCDYSTVGVYASGVSIIGIFNLFQTSFTTLWLPMALEHYSKDKKDKSFYYNANQIMTVILFFVGLVVVFTKDILVLLLGDEYRSAAQILPFLVFYPIMYTVSETTVCGMVFMEKSKLQILPPIVSLLFNFIGNTLLVPTLGARGAAISTGFSYIVFFTMRTTLSNRFFYVDFKLGKFYFITFLMVFYALFNSFYSNSIISCLAFVILSVILMVCYMDAIKMIWKGVIGSVKKDV